jgi:Ras-related protein Rab-1A
MKPSTPKKVPKKHSLKVFACGQASTGKTTLVSKYLRKELQATILPTFRADINLAKTKVSGHTFNLEICDISGNSNLGTEAKNFFIGTHIALVFYDVTDMKSSDSVLAWMRMINECSPSDELVKIMIGNKCDLNKERSVPYSQGQKFAEKSGFWFFEASALTEDREYFEGTKVENILEFAMVKWLDGFLARKAIEAEKNRENEAEELEREKCYQENLEKFREQIKSKMAREIGGMGN